MKTQMIGIKKKKIRIGYIVIIAIVLFCLAFEQISTHRLMNEIDMSNRKIVLNYAAQTAARLKDRFMTLDISLRELKQDIEQTNEFDAEQLKILLQDYNRLWGTDGSGVLLRDGRNMLSDGTYIAFENKVDMQDVLTYSEQLNISKQVIQGKEMLVFSKPCVKQAGDQAVIGIFEAMNLKKIEDMLGEYGYSKNSFLALTQNNGNNLWKQGNKSSNSQTNVFDEMGKLSVHKNDSVQQMKNRIKISMEGTLIYEKDGQEYYLAYVPLDVNYWNLIVSTQSESIDYTVLSRQHFVISGVLTAVIFIIGVFSFLYLLLHNRSITEDNEKLQKAIKLANQANEAKKFFLAKVSHEIRTPLNGIMGMIKLAQMNYQEKEKCLTHLEKATISAKYLLSLMNDVLDMSLIESGKVRLVYETLDFSKLKQELEISLESSYKKKNLSMLIDDTKLKHRYFITDYLRLKQVLMNLLSNAVKYTDYGGNILLQITEEAEKGVSKVRFLVKDNGQGIPREKINKIFEAFEQGDVNVKTRSNGVGLGLSIVKNIVKLMNGEIQVRSTVGEGSEFVVVLPLEIGEVPEERGLETAPDLKGISILLAEDNELNAEICIELLQSEGAEVTWAVDGEDVVEKFAQSQTGEYQVILMDIQMPKKDGIEATMEIRRLQRQDAMCIPIIAITANAFEEQKAEMKQVGINDFLYKPIELAESCSRIRKWVSEEPE